MRIAVLAGSDGNMYGRALVQMLARNKCNLTCAIIQNPLITHQFLKRAKKLSIRNLLKYLKKIKYRDTSNINPFLDAYMNSNNLSQETIMELSGRLGFDILFSDNVNDERLIRNLAKHRPDLLIYCSGGILRKPLLEIPVIGTLNAHMGLLPKYRGMNVLEWSLFYGDPIGVTIHFINTGIDTGDILLQKKMAIKKGDSIDSLRHKAIVTNVDLMVKTVKLIAQGKNIECPNNLLEGKQYFVMHGILKQHVENKLQLMQETAL